MTILRLLSAFNLTKKAYHIITPTNFVITKSNETKTSASGLAGAPILPIIRPTPMKNTIKPTKIKNYIEKSTLLPSKFYIFENIN